MTNYKLGLLVIVLLACVLPGYGQAVSKTDSIAVLRAVTKLFTAFKQANQQQFDEVATNKIDCILCAEQAEKAGEKIELPYLVSRSRFFREYLAVLKKNAHVQRAYALREVKLFYQSPKLIAVLITTWMPNEYASGHEGAQLELDFTKQNHTFLFSGISTVP